MMWRNLNVSPKELRLDVTLTTGQSFRWFKVVDNEWEGTIRSHVFRLQQTEDAIRYRTLTSASPREAEDLLSDYFHLRTVSLEKLFSHWSARDTRLREIAPFFHGARMLRQDPVECLFSFICSANNNIKRITKMVNFLASQYGTRLDTSTSEEVTKGGVVESESVGKREGTGG
eukprot:Rmarinus@m.14693